MESPKSLRLVSWSTNKFPNLDEIFVESANLTLHLEQGNKDLDYLFSSRVADDLVSVLAPHSASGRCD